MSSCAVHYGIDLIDERRESRSPLPSNFVELIFVRVLGGLFGWFDNITDFLLGPSITSWMTETGVRTTGEGAMLPLSDPSSQLHAFLVMRRPGHPLAQGVRPVS